MSEMVERAAKAAWMRYVGIDSRQDWMDDEDWSAAQERRKDWPKDTGLYPDADRFRDCARAAIEAMRDPTEEQYDALSNTGKMWRELNSRTVWQTYIDAALK